MANKIFNDYILDKTYSVIRKVYTDSTPAIMAAVEFEPIVKSLSIGAQEIYIYIASHTSGSVFVVQFSATDLRIISAQSQ